MIDFTTIWSYATKIGSVVTPASIATYFLNKYRKRFSMPELACELVLKKAKIKKLGDTTSDGQGGLIVTPNGLSEVEQLCDFTITNNTEHIALKLRLLGNDSSNGVLWRPEPDYTVPIMPHQSIKQDILIRGAAKSDDVRRVTHEDFLNGVAIIPDFTRIEDEPDVYPFKKVTFEYQNAAGRKYHLIFSPNEKDVTKRNVCKKA